MAKKEQPKKQYRYRVQFDIGYTGSKGADLGGELHTVPDMNLTVRQLLENHTRGKTSEVEVRKPLYFETLIPQMHDITDVEEFQQFLKKQQKLAEDFLKENKDKPSEDIKSGLETLKKRQKDIFDEIEETQNSSKPSPQDVD